MTLLAGHLQNRQVFSAANGRWKPQGTLESNKVPRRGVLMPQPALGESRRQWTCSMTEGAKPFKEHLHQKLTKDAITERNGQAVVLSVWLTQTVAECTSGGVITLTPVAYLR